MKKREISPRLNSIIANIWGADQVKNWKIIENVWKILPGDGSQKQKGWNLCILRNLTAANFTEVSRKHVLAASNRNIKLRIESERRN